MSSGTQQSASLTRDVEASVVPVGAKVTLRTGETVRFCIRGPETGAVA